MKWYKFDITHLDENKYNKWFSMMDKEKQQRVNKFRFYDDKKRTVVGEMLAKMAISEYCNTKIENITFCKNEFGKPFVKDLNIEFNISHSGNMVVCAVDNSPVGIDIEKVREIKLNNVKKLLTENESDYIFGHKTSADDFQKVPDSDILKRFFEIWTKKEAFVKKQGESIFKFNEEYRCNFTTFSLGDDDNNTYVVTIAHS